ncbi:MAG: HAMP domain-containing histidine kinase, partial [Cyanobacteria bacterium CRU_2_1]|nr:HAMP domain-containing histidine kinase [Cyanobacteria bacterium CRU_2_1]
MTPHTKPRISLDKGWFDRLITAPSSLLNRLQPRPDSADYQTWRHHFMLDRLRLCFWIAIPCFLTLSAHSLYVVTFELEELREDITKIYGDPLIADQFKNATIISCEIIAVLLVSCAILSKTAWARRYPALIFLCFSLSLTLTELIVGTFLGFPVNPSTFEFLAQAVLMPVYWQLHLLAQLAPILYYFIIFPILGLTHIGERSLYDSYAIRNVADLFWVCLICDLGVYLYERLKRSEFESRRQLKVFLHSVSHDLRTPVMGTSMVLQKLLKKPDAKISIDRLILERLLEGSDRQLTLINSLLEAHASEIQTPTLNRQPLQLSILVQSALFDLEPALNKNHITVINRVQPNLPLIYADTNQLWRVYCNLITNALKHNPHGINLILDAKLIDPIPRSRYS